MSADATTLQPGVRFERYQIEALLGAGGMGQVFRARDTQLGRSVAIKTSNAMFQTRFRIEARAVAALNHPHICTLYDAGPNYLVMELVEGQSLAARLRQGPLPPEEALRCALQTADALAEAHAHGIVHRDLKPANIMLTRHGVKVLDFGLARLLEEPGLTEAHMILGTPAYMAPEQAEGREPTTATDLFALGLVLYEIATGRLPVPGASLGKILAGGSQPQIPALTQPRPGLPTQFNALVQRLLARDPDQRPASAAAVVEELSALFDSPSAPRGVAGVRRWALAASAALALVVLVGGVLYYRLSQVRWAREQAIPSISSLAARQPLTAFLLLLRAESILHSDPQLAALAAATTHHITITSDPPGASVEIQDYDKPGEWFRLGATPLPNRRIPNGYFRWRISKPGVGEFVSAPTSGTSLNFPLATVHRLNGMVPVPATNWSDFIDFIGWVSEPLPDYDIDRFETTNAQFQRFVDQGGYNRREFWSASFDDGGRELTWEQAMSRFRDRTGRPGPATWEGGHYPAGQADFPVTGVSWYEAAAYAAFVGHSLPTLGQWYQASPPETAADAANVGNFGGNGPAAVGSYAAVGPFGTYDMAGNVREWTLTAVGDQRFILGGAWDTPSYAAFDPDGVSPFDRSPTNGFRTVRNLQPLSPAATAPLVRQGRDFSHEKPASDAVFQAYLAMYAYDHAPLAPAFVGPVEDGPDWTKREITIDAGHDGERLPMYLFLPKRVRPPFQSVLFFPSARVVLLNDPETLGDMGFVDYVVKSGRALLYPIYEGTYNRRAPVTSDVGSAGYLQAIIQQSKEVRRAVDYLASRSDMDATRIGYLGVSMGSAYGVIFTALEPRFRTVVFIDGGMFLLPAPRGADQWDFAPRLTKPALMINGRYDFDFSPERSQDPLFRALGAPATDKRHIFLDTPHDARLRKAALSQAVLAWLDRYLGPVRY